MDAMADFLRQAARDNGIPLTTAAVSAAKINAKVRSADISFHYSSAVSNSTTALTASGGGTRSGRTTVQVYEDNGCLYYEEVAP